MDDDIFFGGGGEGIKAGARMIYRVLLKLHLFLFQFLLLRLTMIIIDRILFSPLIPFSFSFSSFISVI